MISFRKLERCDLPLLLELKRESHGTTHRTTIATIEEQDRWFDSLDNHPHTPRVLYLIAETGLVDGTIVGPVITKFGLFKLQNIDWVSRNADVGWDVFERYRGQGHGKSLVKAGVDYAFRILNLRRLSAEILSNNPASEKCALHAGFVVEGVKKQFAYKIVEPENPFDPPPSEYLDSTVYGLLRADWLAKI